MKVSGREIAQRLLTSLKQEIQQNNLKPGLAIILAGNNPSSEIYVANKIKAASEIGIKAETRRFIEPEREQCISEIEQLNKDPNVHGIIVQYPIYESWNFEEICLKVDPQKDVDGFVMDSKFNGATALGIWEMLKEFAKIEGFSVEEFLKGKKIIILGKGRSAGAPTIRLLRTEGLEPIVIDSKTENPDEIIRISDVVISATGRRNIINGSNVKLGSYVIGVGVGRDEESGKTFGDINEKEVSEKAKLYCPTIGGIGPLTVACLLKNVTESARQTLSSCT
ncbi:MAG: bifunctional 5,10-methylenetetrahydrofolate dehydrogenase/5,10-methenyltetrahydrofolate cyclohydrolase [Candidatus Daviesbacteria bacterium]|nr:bifunctional 5,10-methylenetetrahydrofolate dehydrogenase/5,10-methenyltetrahydrofolate cyclohydrolase [Candidatus Daviesbacteria bacterium]